MIDWTAVFNDVFFNPSIITDISRHQPLNKGRTGLQSTGHSMPGVGPTGGKIGRPQSFHAPIVGAQGSFSCSFYPEYAKNCTPSALRPGVGPLYSREDSLEQARAAFLAIMERQDQAVPTNFSDFSASFLHRGTLGLGTREEQRPMTTDLLNEMLSQTGGRSRLGTASRTRKAHRTSRPFSDQADIPSTPFSLPAECRMSTIPDQENSQTYKNTASNCKQAGSTPLHASFGPSRGNLR